MNKLTRRSCTRLCTFTHIQPNLKETLRISSNNRSRSRIPIEADRSQNKAGNARKEATGCEERTRHTRTSRTKSKKNRDSRKIRAHLGTENKRLNQYSIRETMETYFFERSKEGAKESKSCKQKKIHMYLGKHMLAWLHSSKQARCRNEQRS